jgi:hypothetical protein
MYDRVIDWYKVAETKAQFLLTVNGAFVTIAFDFYLAASKSRGAPSMPWERLPGCS